MQAEKQPALQRRHTFGKGPTNNTKNNNLKCKNKCILGGEDIPRKAEDMAVTLMVVNVDPIHLRCPVFIHFSKQKSC